MGAAPTKPGRASTARWCGSGERDEEEYARNQRRYVPQGLTGSNLADMGRVRCVPVGGFGGELRGGHVDVHREATVKCCGVGVAMPQGQSWAPPSSSESTVNTGTVSVLARCHTAGVDGRAGSIVDRSGRDGAEPP